jgi:hypothetical protein
MGIHDDQFFLNEPLSYATGVSLSDVKDLVDRDNADKTADLGRFRTYQVPPASIDGATKIFSIPEASSYVRVFRNGVEEDPANVTQPSSTQFELPTNPRGPSDVGGRETLSVVYYPDTGLSSNHSDRMTVTSVSTTSTLTIAQTANALVYVPTANITITLPNLTITNAGMNFRLHVTGDGVVTFLPGSGDTIQGTTSLDIDTTLNRSAKFVYSYEHRDWVVPMVRVIVGQAFAPAETQTNAWQSIVEGS